MDRVAIHLLLPFAILILAIFGVRRSFRQMQKLEAPRRLLVGRSFIFAFVATLSVSLSGLTYLIWTYSKSGLLLIATGIGLCVFLFSVVMIARISMQLSALPRQ